MTNQSTTTKAALEPCPKCNDCWVLQVQEQEPPLLAKTVTCGRCGFRAPFDTWQARVTAPIVAPEVDENSVAFNAYNQAIEDAKAAIRAESQGGGYWAAVYINAIARRCSPHVYVNRLTAFPVDQSKTEFEQLSREQIIQAITDIEDARESHVEWAAHLRVAHTFECQGCTDHAAHIGTAEYHDEWIAKYDNVIAVLARVPVTVPASPAALRDEAEPAQFNVLAPEQASAQSVKQLAYWTWRKLSGLNFANVSGEIEAAINHALKALGGDAFKAYNQAVEDAKTAIHEAPSYHQDDDYCAASFINAIARKCSPHVYVNKLVNERAATTPPSTLAKTVVQAAAKEIFWRQMLPEEEIAEIIKRCFSARGGSDVQARHS